MRGAGALLGLALAACGEERAPSAPPPVSPADPACRTEWHREPVLAKAAARNVVFYDHADAKVDAPAVAALLQKQYEWLRDYLGVAPEWVLVHGGSKYPCGFAIPGEPHPEMFLKEPSLLDTSADYAHEMTHCFAFRWGSIPHWFNESIADVSYADAEIELWKRRGEKEMLERFDRVDNRSYELMRLRAKYGRGYFPKVYRLMEARREECLHTFRYGVPLETKNLLLLSFLSEAAGEDLLPYFRSEFGFDPRTRERQRGY